MRQFDSLLRQPAALRDLGNMNLVWARLMVEELCRLGITTYFIALFTLTLPHLAVAAAFSAVAFIPMTDLNQRGTFPLQHSPLPVCCCSPDSRAHFSEQPFQFSHSWPRIWQTFKLEAYLHDGVLYPSTSHIDDG